MSSLQDYIIYNSETQYEKSHGYSKDYLFEIYGKTEGGTLFERDLVSQDKILLHVGDGIRKAESCLDRDSVFFRKNQEGSKFFANYSDYLDFKFNKQKELSKDYIIQIVKRYVYMESPRVWSSTLMGGGGDGVLENPNWMHGAFILEDDKEYTIIKKYDTVKIFEGNKNMYAYDDEKEYCSFKLEEDLYKNALRLMKLKRFMALNSFGRIDIDKYKEFISIYEEIDEATTIYSI